MVAVLKNGVQLSYEVLGSGEPLVLVAGFGCTKDLWSPRLLSALAKHYQLVCYDHRTVGGSSAPSPRMTMQDLADDLAALLDHLDLAQAHVFGVSMGGMIAQEFALRHPQRLQKLILGCTTARSLPAAANASAAALMFPHLVPRLFLRALFSARFLKTQRQEAAAFLRATLQARPPLQVLLGQLRAALRHNTKLQLKAISKPTLVLTGSADKVIPAHCSTYLTQQIVGAKLVVLPDAGHAFFVERDLECAAELLQFLHHKQAVDAPAPSHKVL